MSSLVSSFHNLKVSIKIGIGFAVMLMVTMAVAAMGYAALDHTQEEVGLYSQQVKIVGIARDIDREFLSFRRYVREYALTGDEAALKKSVDERPALEAAISAGLTEIKNPDRLAKMKAIEQDYASYLKNLDKLVELRKAQTVQTVTKLDPAGKSLRVDTEALIKSGSANGETNTVILGNQAMEQLMLARLSVNKHLARHDEEAKVAADKAFEELNGVLEQLDKVIISPDAKSLHDKLVETAKAYHEAYEEANRDAAEIASLINDEMRKEAEDIAANAEVIKKSGLEEEHKVERETNDTIESSQQSALLFSICGALIGIVLAALIGRGIARPISEIAGVLLKLAEGNKAVDVPYVDRKDEVGENARAAAIFKENLIRIENMEAEKKEAERRAAEQRRADMRRLADEFQRAVGGIITSVSSASSELEAAAESLTNTASQTQSLSTMVAAASEQTSANVQGVAAASEELASTVSEIGRQVEESSNIASQAVAQAAKTNDRVMELSQSADKIGNVISLINNIAGQTNLLALNATIEAARAGEAGKGFAVVAQEVKALADQTGKATSDIAAQISAMQSSTSEAVQAIKDISDTIAQISHISGAIAAAVEEQSATTREISRNVLEAAKGTSEVASSITDVNRGASDTGSASSQVLTSAKDLAHQSGTLRAELDKFLETVRAA